MRHAHPPIARRLALLAATGIVLLGAGPLAQRDGIPKNPDERVITHVLNRLGYGARPGDVERVKRMGLTAYINDQLNPAQIADAALIARLEQFPTLAMSQEQLVAEVFGPAEEQRRMLQQRQAAQARAAAADPAMTAATPPAGDPLRQQLTQEQRMIQQAAQAAPQELMQAKILRAVMSERQLEEVLVDFWFNHFNVFIGKGQVRQYLNEYERDVIRPHVLGNFRELLGATAQSPAMLFYLDNFQSQAPAGAVTLGPGNDRRGRGVPPPNRRPGQMPPGVRPGQIQIPIMPPPQPNRPQRGLNENYARELMELHTLGVDGGYTQQDVVELARILTGWTIDRPQLGGSFVFRPQAHDAGDKVLLGTKFPAGKGMEEGERALDLLAAHPSTAKHIAFKLAQRFVADTPPQALVDRAAKKFTESKGNLREVTRVIVTSPEFFAADAYRAKVKTPFEFVVSAARAANANIANAQPIVNALRTDLGMPLYGCQPPTGYSMTADAWVNTGSLLNRMNFALQLVSGGQQMQLGRGGRIGGPPPPQRPNPQQLQRQQQQQARLPFQVNIAALAPDTTDASRDALVNTVLSGQASAATRETLARAETPHHLIALTLGSPEFQRR